MDFFDEYPCFYKTSIVGSTPNRLNSRYRAMIQANLDCINGCSILDIASHDGRWSFAALKNGARHVLGIEARHDLVDAAVNTFELENLGNDRFTFIENDIYKQLPKIQPGSIDTVFLFGFFYHTMHHHLLLGSIAALRPKHVILDTRVFPSGDPVIHITAEDTDEPGNVFPSPVDHLKTSLVGYPSRAAMELMLENFGFRFHYFDWLSMPVSNWENIEDYRDGLRTTLRASLG